MSLADYEQLAARSFEEPHDAELRAAVLVCADALSQEGDPRGPLIAMEHALYDADRKRAIEFRKAMHEHAAGEGSSLLGAAAALMNVGRALSLEWRSGKIYGISVDARYMPEKSKEPHGELVKQVIQAPAARALRRLRVRVRREEDTGSIIEMLGAHEQPPPLEELELYSSVWPQGTTRASPRITLDRYAGLYYLVIADRIAPLTPMGNQYADVDRFLRKLPECEPPITGHARTFLGRCLTHTDRTLRIAALERVRELGMFAKTFERILCVLLQPRVSGLGGTGEPATHLELVQALAAMQPSAAARRVLAKVASRPENYDAPTRSAAGQAIS